MEALDRRPVMPLTVFFFVMEPLELGTGLPGVLEYVLDIPLASDRKSLNSYLPLQLDMT